MTPTAAAAPTGQAHGRGPGPGLSAQDGTPGAVDAHGRADLGVRGARGVSGARGVRGGVLVGVALLVVLGGLAAGRSALWGGADVVVAGRDLAAGHVLVADDLRREPGPVAGSPGPAAEDLLDTVVRAPLAAGSVLTADHVTAFPAGVSLEDRVLVHVVTAGPGEPQPAGAVVTVLVSPRGGWRAALVLTDVPVLDSRPGSAGVEHVLAVAEDDVPALAQLLAVSEVRVVLPAGG